MIFKDTIIVTLGCADQKPGLGNTRGLYCNSNSGGSELQEIGQFLSPLELYWKELIRN